MKRIIIYILLLGAAASLPFRGTDVGKLQPVGLIQLYMEDGMVVIVTDTGDSGRGDTAEAAFENLEDSTSGLIFLDTADYLLMSKEAISQAEGLQRYLKPSIRVCLAEQGIDPVQAAEYLAVHRPLLKMKNISDFGSVQTLRQENGRLILE